MTSGELCFLQHELARAQLAYELAKRHCDAASENRWEARVHAYGRQPEMEDAATTDAAQANLSRAYRELTTCQAKLRVATEARAPGPQREACDRQQRNELSRGQHAVAGKMAHVNR